MSNEHAVSYFFLLQKKTFVDDKKKPMSSVVIIQLSLWLKRKFLLCIFAKIYENSGHINGMEYFGNGA
jgi:hypothetical protein